MNTTDWRRRLILLIGGLVSVAGLLTGCTPGPASPDLPSIYNRSAQYHGVDRNPVILIPGILGSKLRNTETGSVVWGAFTGEYADPEEPGGARQVALPMREGGALRNLRDSVAAAGALDRLKLDVLGLPIKLDAYANILGALGVGGYRSEELGLSGAIDYGDDHFTCFQFDYDWRRDNVENARRLHQFIQKKRAYVQREYEARYGISDYDVKFDIVAHSMGGLLTRYFLRYGDQGFPDEEDEVPPVTWKGAEHVERVVLVGTPNAGSAKALSELVRGKSFSRFVPEYAPAIIGTMPAAYQLLPRARHEVVVTRGEEVPVDSVLYSAFWERMEWGLANPEQDQVLQQLLPEVDRRAERQRIARDHLQKSLQRARRFHAALDTPATPPDHLSLMLIAGDAEPTLSALRVDRTKGTLAEHGTQPGDGTVTRASALMDERQGGSWAPELVSPIEWDQVFFLFSEHVALTKDPAFTDNLLYVLLEHPR